MKMVKVNFYIESKAWEKLRKLAEKSGVSASLLLRFAVEYYLEKQVWQEKEKSLKNPS